MNLNMDHLISRASRFIRREKLYFFLLIFVLLVSISLSFLSQILVDTGMSELFVEGEAAEEIIPPEKVEEAFTADPTLYIIFLAIVLFLLLFCLVGIILDVLYLYLNQTGESLIGRTRPPECVKWEFWDICKAVIIFLFAQRVLLFAELFVFRAVPFLEDKDNLRLMMSATIADIAVISAILFYVLKERRQKVDSLGLTPKRFFVNIRYGILAYVGLMPILAVVMFGTTNLFRYFNIPVEPQPVLIILKEETHIPSLVYMCFFTSLLGPVLEEIFFRGFLYGVLKKRAGVFWGIFLSAAFFAYIHANLASFFPILCLGILLAYLYERTGSLIPSITVHAIHNSLSLAFLLFIKSVVG